MTYEMEYAARLFSCGAQGIPAPSPERPVDWEKVVRIAVEQSVTYTVALAMKNNDLGCPPDIRERLTASQRGAAVKNYFKTRRILEIVGEMENSGVPVIIIKGIDAAAAYASPECRVSADTDLLVRPDDEEKALLLLRKRGFETDTRKKHDADTMCSHPELGLLELHISLMVESHMNEFPGCDRLGERAFEASVMREYDGFKYRALEPTDNMLFLTYHMLKHLITNGISLRMLMDNALFSMKNASDIDRTRCAYELSLTGYSRAVRLLFGTAARYFGIAEECFPIEPITDAQGTETFMTDLEEGGWEGYKNKANPGAWAWQYYRRENAGKAGRENGLSNMRGGGMYILRSAMFPGKYKMKAAYPVLKKHMILYPFCWAHRLLREGLPWLRRGGLKKVVPPSGSETRLSGEARERLELYRRLELIDGGK